MKAKKDSWKTKSMPGEKESLVIDRKITNKELAEVQKGLVPVQMEDKWFIFSEDNKVYFHRSWTGTCIYEATFIELDAVTYQFNQLVVNRNKEEYKATDSAYDIEMFNFLLDRLLLNKQVSFPDRDPANSNEQNLIERHAMIGYGQSRKEINEE